MPILFISCGSPNKGKDRYLILDDDSLHSFSSQNSTRKNCFKLSHLPPGQGIQFETLLLNPKNLENPIKERVAWAPSLILKKALSKIEHNGTYFDTSSGVFNTVKKGETVRFCQGQVYTSRNIEHAALIAAWSIDQVLKSLTDSPSLEKALQHPVELSIHPHVYHKLSLVPAQYRKAFEDNVFWSYNPIGGQPQITLLPHSKEYVRRNSILFSDQPLIFAHEYSHHLYHLLAPQLRRIEEYKNSHGLKAFNEGFADFLAFSAFKGSLKPWAFLLDEDRIHDRQVYSERFDSGYSKILSKDNLEQFFSPHSSLPNPHKLGSIIALVLFNSLSSQNDSLRLGLNFLIHIEKKHKAIASAKNSIEELKILMMEFKNYLESLELPANQLSSHLPVWFYDEQ